MTRGAGATALILIFDDIGAEKGLCSRQSCAPVWIEALDGLIQM